MLPSLFLSLLLTVSDPRNDVNDAILPIVSAIPDTSVFDVERISVAESDTLSLSITMGSLANPWQLPYGFSFPIIELYLNDNDPEAATGTETLLPGSDMLLDEGEDWNYAFRLTGDGLVIYRGFEGGYEDVSDVVSSELRRDDTHTLIIETNLPIPEDYSLYGLVGSYDPFSSTGWRTLNSSDAEGNLQPISPVLEVIADDVETQEQALSSKTLPRIDVAQQQHRWLWVVGGGLLLSLLAFISWIASFFGRSSKKSANNKSVNTPSVIDKQRAQGHTRTTASSTPNSPDPIERGATAPIGRAGRGQAPATTTASSRAKRHVTDPAQVDIAKVGKGSSFPKAHQFTVNDTEESFHASSDSTSLWGRQGRGKAFRPTVGTNVEAAEVTNAPVTTIAEETTSLGQIKTIALHKNKTETQQAIDNPIPQASGKPLETQAEYHVHQNNNAAHEHTNIPITPSASPQQPSDNASINTLDSHANTIIKNNLRTKVSYTSNAPQKKARHLPKNILIPKEEKAR